MVIFVVWNVTQGTRGMDGYHGSIVFPSWKTNTKLVFGLWNVEGFSTAMFDFRRVFHRKWPVYSMSLDMSTKNIDYFAPHFPSNWDMPQLRCKYASGAFWIHRIPAGWVQQCTIIPTQQMNFGKRNHFPDCALGNSFVFLWPVFRVPIIRRWQSVVCYPSVSKKNMNMSSRNIFVHVVRCFGFATLTFWYFLWKRDPHCVNKHALMRGYQPPTPTSLLVVAMKEALLSGRVRRKHSDAWFVGFPWRQQGYITNDDLLADFTCLCFSPSTPGVGKCPILGILDITL